VELSDVIASRRSIRKFRQEDISADTVQLLLNAARVWNPDIFLSLGCAKPSGDYKRQVENLAIDCGFNGIAFPSDEAIDHACARGLHPVFTEECCSMAGHERA